MDVKELGSKEQNDEQKMVKDTTNGWHRDICRGIIRAYFLVIVGIYPFYAPGGYMNIGEVKYVFFRNVSLVTLAVMVVVILLSIVSRRDSEWLIRNYRQMSVTDWLAYGYIVTVMLSYLCSAYKKDALWGVQGWYMGVITQMIFILTYFLFSRYFHCNLGWISAWLVSAAAVFLLGICNRYSLYPIVMEGQRNSFISTLGNINWFCGYWSVAASIGITLYWCSEKMWVRAAAGMYSMIAMLSGITQGSESAYPVFAVVFLMLFVLSFGNHTRMYRFLELCMIFAGSCLLAQWMTHIPIPGLKLNYVTEESTYFDITMSLLFGNTAVWILLITLGSYILLRVVGSHAKPQTDDFTQNTHKHYWLRGIVMTAVVAAACIAALALLVVSGALYTRETPDATNDDSIRMVFNENWGSGRGASWNCGINAYQSMDLLHKIVGVGPDCFADYVYDLPGMAERLAEQFAGQRLTNAHNEQLTMLVNVGVLGWLCYAGVFLTAFVRYLKKARRQPMLYLCAVSILAYTVHNLVSFQQVLNTPYVFIVLGIGEAILKEPESEQNLEQAHRHERA